MAEVSLRPITTKNFGECIALQVADHQKELVAPNVKSLAQAYVNSTLSPFGIYDAAAHYQETPPMLGFIMCEIANAVGFILRLMVAEKHQCKGYGKAAMLEAIRRLKLHPEVEIIATSHLKKNKTAATLYKSLGFINWDHEVKEKVPHERYLILQENQTI